MAGCDGNCSCAVWHSRHEAAMALYDTMEKMHALEDRIKGARLEAVEAVKQELLKHAHEIASASQSRRIIMMICSRVIAS